jgi:predicted amidohydrolase YtcJ
MANTKGKGISISLCLASHAIVCGMLAISFCDVASFAQSPAVSVTADTILTNGKIFTSNAAHPFVQALAIRGDRILAAGDTASIAALAGAKTVRIDLGGRTVIPGINDAHNHIEIGPANSVDLAFSNFDPTWGEVKAKVIAAVEEKPYGTFIEGDIGGQIFHDPAVYRQTLDAISPDDPVLLTTLTGHAAIANSAALRAASISEDQKDPVGARYERSADGRLTGVIREYARMEINRSLADRTSDNDAIAELRKTLEEAVRFGITTIQDMSNAMPPERAIRLLERVPIPIRIRVIRMAMTTPSGRDINEGWPPPSISNPLLTVSGTKWMLDGTALEGTFLPRTDSTSIGKRVLDLGMTFPSPQLPEMLHESLKRDGQLLLHVSGRSSAAAMLQAMEQNGGAHVWATRRVRFEHGDGLTPDLLPATRELGIIVVQNPTHLDGKDMVPAFGDLAVKLGIQPLRSLLAAGIPIALGSDGPTNPYLNIMFAVTHPDNPAEALTREQAVIAYTAGSAYAEFAEKDKGTLEPGKLADLAVLSRDVFSVPIPELPKIVSVLTMVGGKIVYDANAVHEAVEAPNQREDANNAIRSK